MSTDRDERSLLTDEMRAAVGQDFRWLTSFPISAQRDPAVGDGPLLPGRSRRRCSGTTTTRRRRAFGGIVAPEDFNPFAWMTADPRPDTIVRAGRPWPEPELGLPEPPARANILSGLEVAYTGVRMRPGDVVRSTTRLAGYHEREGRLGLMLFTTTRSAG